MQSSQEWPTPGETERARGLPKKKLEREHAGRKGGRTRHCKVSGSQSRRRQDEHLMPVLPVARQGRWAAKVCRESEPDLGKRKRTRNERKKERKERQRGEECQENDPMQEEEEDFPESNLVSEIEHNMEFNPVKSIIMSQEKRDKFEKMLEEAGQKKEVQEAKKWQDLSSGGAKIAQKERPIEIEKEK